MGKVTVGPDERERQLNAIIAEYRRAVEAGEVTDQRAFLERYPEHAGMLLSLLAPRARRRKAGEGNAVKEFGGKIL